MNHAINKLTPVFSRIARQKPTVATRNFAADAHGEVKYNAWEKPTEVAKWKEEHIVFAVLGGWAVGITAAFKLFGGKKATPEPAAGSA